MFGRVVQQPPQSPDLSPLDFSTWSYWAGKMAEKNPTDQISLRAAVIQPYQELDDDVLYRTVMNVNRGFVPRLHKCVESSCKAFEGALKCDERRR